MLRVSFAVFLITFYLLGAVICPPVTEKPPPTVTEKPEEAASEKDEITQLSYDKYMQEVLSLLMSDSDFAKEMMKSGRNVSLKSGEIAKHLDFVSHGIRTRLDELKRKEVDRLRQVMRLKTILQKGLKVSHPDLVLPELDKEKMLGHLDHSNPNTFEVADLARLIKQATQDLEDIDRKRRDEFKNYELEKEVLRREQMKGLNDTQRHEEEKKFDELQKKHADHPKLNHPGNEEQLKEVWEESDGLSKKDFEPKTFFHLHDTNGDGFLDAAEVEALFQQELDKVYDPNAPEDDMMERYEEMNRMREHLVKEVDRNKDQLISLQEFIDSTKRDEFKKDEDWELLDKETVFSEEELAEFQKNYEERIKVEQEEKESERKQQEIIDQQKPREPQPAKHQQQLSDHDETKKSFDGQHQPDINRPLDEVKPAGVPVAHDQQSVQQVAVHGQQHAEQPVQHIQQPAQQPVQHMKQAPRNVQQPVVHEQQPVQFVQQPVEHVQQPAQAPEQHHAQQPVANEQEGQQVQQEQHVVQQQDGAPLHQDGAPQPVGHVEG